MKNDELAEKIQKSLERGISSYCIDDLLLKEGYNPVDIEAAWQRIEINLITKHRTRPKNLRWWLGIAITIVIISIIFSPDIKNLFSDGKLGTTFIDGKWYYVTREEVDTHQPTYVITQVRGAYTTTLILTVYKLYECEAVDSEMCKEVGKETTKPNHSDLLVYDIEFDNNTQDIHTIHSTGDEYVALERNMTNSNITLTSTYWTRVSR